MAVGRRFDEMCCKSWQIVQCSSVNGNELDR